MVVYPIVCQSHGAGVAVVADGIQNKAIKRNEAVSVTARRTASERPRAAGGTVHRTPPARSVLPLHRRLTNITSFIADLNPSLSHTLINIYPSSTCTQLRSLVSCHPYLKQALIARNFSIFN